MLESHPAASVMPRMSDKEYADLVESVRANGLLETIKLLDGKIIDGRHRYMACQEAEVPARTEEVEIGDTNPVLYVWSLHSIRRHLTTSQRSIIGAAMLESLSESRVAPDGPGQNCPRGGRARDEAAGVVAVSSRTLHTAAKVMDADPDLADRVRQGEMTLAQAARESGVIKTKEVEEEKPYKPPKAIQDIHLTVAEAKTGRKHVGALIRFLQKHDLYGRVTDLAEIAEFMERGKFSDTMATPVLRG